MAKWLVAQDHTGSWWVIAPGGTVRKTAELVVRAALAHMREVHREAH